MSFRDEIKKFANMFYARRRYVQRMDTDKTAQWRKQLTDLQEQGKISPNAQKAGNKIIDVAWFLFCLGKFGLKDSKKIFNNILHDNTLLIDKWEQDKQKLQITNPRIKAVLQLWMVYALMIMSVMGAGKIGKDKKDVSQTFKEWKENKEIDKELDDAKQHTFAAYQERLQPITPWLIAELIAAEGVHVNEQGLHTPYLDGNNNWTMGFGNTIHKDGSSVTQYSKPITTEEAYEWARWHLEEQETFFYLYCYSVFDNELTVRNTGEAFGLSSIMYNSGTKFIESKNDKNHKERFALLRDEYKKYGAAITDSVVANAFAKYPIRNKAGFGKAWIDSHQPQVMADSIGAYMLDGAGMHWRRWLEAGLITGDIQPNDLLECPIKGMYDFYIYMGGGSGRGQKGKFALWKETKNGLTPIKSTYEEFKKWLGNPQQLDVKTGKLIPIKRKKVKDYLPANILSECQKGQCEFGGHIHKTKKDKEISTQTYIIEFEDYYASAMQCYRQYNYQQALTILEKLSESNPNNALLHNDLALTYNKTGQYNEAIKHAQVIVRQIGDKSQYGAAQYNAGYAYEQLGNLQKALQNYGLALSNGNNAAREAIKRVRKNIQKQKSKATAFNDGILKIQEKQNQSGNTFILSPDNEYMA